MRFNVTTAPTGYVTTTTVGGDYPIVSDRRCVGSEQTTVFISQCVSVELFTAASPCKGILASSHPRVLAFVSSPSGKHIGKHTGTGTVFTYMRV